MTTTMTTTTKTKTITSSSETLAPTLTTSPPESATLTLTPATPPPSEWLDTWLRIPFYERKKCEEHSKYHTIYCMVCKGQTYCEKCWRHTYSQHHAPHSGLTLQVCAASRRAAIEVEKIRKFYDISDIQRYIINENSIVYLNPNLKSSADLKLSPKCKICARKLKDPCYSLCSIACKSRSLEPKMQSKTSDEYKRMRKRKRKGIPRRAPFR